MLPSFFRLFESVTFGMIALHGLLNYVHFKCKQHFFIAQIENISICIIATTKSQQHSSAEKRIGTAAAMC